MSEQKQKRTQKQEIIPQQEKIDVSAFVLLVVRGISAHARGVAVAAALTSVRSDEASVQALGRVKSRHVEVDDARALGRVVPQHVAGRKRRRHKKKKEEKEKTEKQNKK